MRILTLVLFSLLSAAALAGPSDTVQMLQTRWAEIKYKAPEADQEKLFAELVQQADVAAKAETGNADVLIWQGIIHASYAGAKGGLGALGEVKKAKASLEQALEINANALDGSAYTSLGSLYYQVPGWPIGFGDSKKAREFLEKGLALNPQGIDPNFFYGDFLLSKGEYEQALASFDKALSAPPRPGRELADSGRRQEIEKAIAKAKDKMK